MSLATRRSIPLVFVDTNVFYPVRLADLVLSSAGDGLFDLCVSDHLLDEIERVLTDDKGHTEEKSRVFREAVRASATVHVKALQYDQVRNQLDGPDTDDLWHLAAAICGGADFVLTANVRDYERAQVPDALTSVVAVNPDDFSSDYGPRVWATTSLQRSAACRPN